MDKLLQKYDIQGPRYTSFPPVPFWNGAPSYSTWLEDIKKSYDPELGIDLYLHIPFCYSICHYCGCNREAAQDNSREAELIEKLLGEWRTYQRELGIDLRVNSIHFGGGTPTYLSPESFAILLSELKKNTTDHFIGSVELHPNVTSEEHLKVFKEFAINRISIGVQDLNDQVLTACNRKTHTKQIIDFYQLCRSYQFESINFDLIYGLPYQTEESMKQTFEMVASLRPDMIAYFSFAYVPWKMSNQELLPKEALPSPELKANLFKWGKEKLLDAGYAQIGLDHFAVPESFLARAYSSKNLKRSFMGYVDQKSNITLGLGPSAISNTPYSFAQNQKSVADYYSSLEKLTESRFCAGHQLTRKDQQAQQLIHDIMCNGVAELQVGRSNLTPSLQEMISDGIIEVAEVGGKVQLQVTDLGRPFVRNVAMQFDHYLESGKDLKIFSKTV